MRMHRSTFLAALALLAACGSSDSSESADSTDTASATTVVAATTTAPATTAPTTTVVDEPRTFDQSKILHEGVFYTAGDLAIGSEIRFIATDKSRYANNLPGFFSVQGQASGDEVLLSISDLSTAFVFKNPVDDILAYGGDNSLLLAATDPVPADYFAYTASLPGVTVGEVTETEFAGFAARSMTYAIGDFTGVPCFGNGKPCLLTMFQPSGISVVYNPGDTGTYFIFDVDGHTVLVDVIDSSGAEPFLATFSIG